jgi:crotonobetainyl-CoA:carnitine CoA-transferase CaiB-like acyl-CoA transferase
LPDDLADEPRFATAAARRAHFAELHHIVQTWISTFCDIGALDAQLDAAEIVLGEVRSLKNWRRWNGRNIGVPSRKSRIAMAGPTDCPAAHGAFRAKRSSRSATGIPGRTQAPPKIITDDAGAALHGKNQRGAFAGNRLLKLTAEGYPRRIRREVGLGDFGGRVFTKATARSSHSRKPRSSRGGGSTKT